MAWLFRSGSHTTDFADKLQKKLNAAVEAESEFAILEVSSHSIAQNRISGCVFDGLFLQIYLKIILIITQIWNLIFKQKENCFSHLI